MDMLSNLPDPILSHILSYLPTKTSIACGALSKRWQLLWTRVPVIDLDEHRDMPMLRYEGDYEEKRKEMASHFLKIVDRVYSLPRELPVKKLRLSMGFNHSLHLHKWMNHLHKWISADRFEELDLAVPYKVITFPRIYRYTNMVVLKLSYSYLGLVNARLFPKVRVLHLSSVSFEDEDEHGGSLENFLSACPILEELSCRNLRIHDDTIFMICVPTLTSLVLHCDGEDGVRFTSKFELQTPALEYLSFKHDIAIEDCLVTYGSLCNLRKADIISLAFEDSWYRSHVMGLLKNLSSVEFLKLSCPNKKTRYGSFTPSRGLGHNFNYHRLDRLPVFDNLIRLPVFDNLIRLELCIPSSDCVVLPHLLQKFPNLKHISIDKVFGIEEAEVCWEEPREVPICLSSTLLSFCFLGFECFEVEEELVKYVKKHARVLKNMTIKNSSCFKAFEARVEAMRKLPMVLTGDETCVSFV